MSGIKVYPTKSKDNIFYETSSFDSLDRFHIDDSSYLSEIETVDEKFLNIFNNNLTPNIYKVDINSFNGWRNSEVNHIIYKLSKISNFVDAYEYKVSNYKIAYKYTGSNTTKLTSLESATSFVEYDYYDHVERKVSIDVSERGGFVPLKRAQNLYYSDYMSRSNFSRSVKSDLDFEKIYNLDENHTYQFVLKYVRDVKTIKFLYSDNIFVYINFNETYKDKDRKVNYITVKLEVVDILEIEPYEYLDDISELMNILRDGSVMSSSFIKEIFKSYKSKDSGTSGSTRKYYIDPIIEPFVVTYETLFDILIPRHVLNESVNIYPRYNGLYVESKVSRDLFVISLKFSSYFKRYFLRSKSTYKSKDQNEMFSVSKFISNKYTSFKALIYTDKGKDILTEFMRTENNTSLQDIDINIIVIQQLYTYKEGGISEAIDMRTSSLPVGEGIEELISSFGFNLTKDYKIQMSQLLKSSSIHDYYRDLLQNTDYEINGLALKSTVTGNINIINEITYLDAVIDIDGNIISDKVYMNIVDPKDVKRVSLETFNNLSLVEAMFKLSYMIFEIYIDVDGYVKISKLKLHVRKYDSIKTWSNENLYLKMEDLELDPKLNLYEKYLVHQQKKILEIISSLYINLIIDINPVNILSSESIDRIVIDPVKTIDKRYEIIDADFDLISQAIAKRDVKRYAVILHNISDVNYRELALSLMYESEYLHILDIFILDQNINYNPKDFKWSKSVNVEAGKVEIENGDLSLYYESKQFLNIESPNIVRYSSIETTNNFINEFNINRSSISNTILSRFFVDNLFRLLVFNTHDIEIKRITNTNVEHISDIIESRKYNFIIDGVKVDFTIDPHEGVVESLSYAIFQTVTDRKIDEFIDNINQILSLKRSNMTISRDMKLDRLDAIKFLSKFLKIQFIILDISDRTIYLRTENYPRIIYFLTDKDSIFILKRNSMYMSYFDL